MYAQNFISTTEYITLTSQQVFISKVTNLFSVKWKTNKQKLFYHVKPPWDNEGTEMSRTH